LKAPTLDREGLLALERIELLAKLDGHEGAPNAREIGLVQERVAGAWALGRARDSTTRFNRVFGLGLERPATPEDIVALKAFYARHEIPTFRIPLPPIAEPEGFDRTLAAAGFGSYRPLVKWARDTSPAKPSPTTLKIERAVPGDAEGMDQVLLEAFGGRPHSVPFAASLIDRPHWHHYVARDGGTVVAAAVMYAREGYAWLGAAGTRASHRGHGAQSALIAKRIDDARALGCRALTTETEPDPPEKPNPSYHNMGRAGFQVLYERLSWVFPNPRNRDS